VATLLTPEPKTLVLAGMQADSYGVDDHRAPLRRSNSRESYMQSQLSSELASGRPGAATRASLDAAVPFIVGLARVTNVTLAVRRRARKDAGEVQSAISSQLDLTVRVMLA
jgi:hypothetical protein